MRSYVGVMKIGIIVGFVATVFIFFQNCSKVAFNDLPQIEKNNGSAGLTNTTAIVACAGISCELTPLTTKAAVSTILLTLGDQANSSLVIDGASSQLISETIIRSSSPVINPKILLVIDSVNGNEDNEDVSYISQVLLARYQVTMIKTSVDGITENDVNGFDVVWYNNPGHPMSSQKTLRTLLNFKGGVILQGDDLSVGTENGVIFSLHELTGLMNIDNGSNVKCGSISYLHDNNQGHQYRVAINASKIKGQNSSVLNFRYGNDIDNTRVVSDKVEIIASAVGGPESCTESRPAIVRYLKN